MINICKLHNMVEENGIIFLNYGGFLSQSILVSMTEALEKEATFNNLDLNMSNKILTIFIELMQNMMNYSKSSNIEESQKSQGLIFVIRDKNNDYQIHTQNIVSKEDKEKLTKILEEIQQMDRDEIKKKYRELRRNGKNSHEKGGGIGFFEIAKKCDKINFEFEKINDQRYYFHLNIVILNKKKDK